MSLDLKGCVFMTSSNRKLPAAKISMASALYSPFPSLLVISGALHLMEPTPSQTL